MFAQNSGDPPPLYSVPGQRETALWLCVITVLRVIPISPRAMLSQVGQCLHSILPFHPQQRQKQYRSTSRHIRLMTSDTTYTLLCASLMCDSLCCMFEIN